MSGEFLRKCEIRLLLEALSVALDDRKGRGYWPIRKWMNDRDIYNEDVNDEYALKLAIDEALKRMPAEPQPAALPPALDRLLKEEEKR